MKYSQARQGRTFIIRLEDGEILHETLESFAVEHNIQAAALIALGGADANSRLISGPREGRAPKIETIEQVLDNVHEVTGTGTLFRDDTGHPTLHMHLACGRRDQTLTGCVRQGVKVWHILEIILFEIVETSACRQMDPALGFKLLQP